MDTPSQDAANSPPVPAPRPKRRSDHAIKLAFIGATLVVVAVIVLKQRSGLNLPGWGDDLSSALAQASAENRPVLAFFVSSPPDHTSREMTKNTLPKNAQAIEAGRFIKVVVKVSNRGDPSAVRYKVRNLPTMLVIGPDGVEKNRREGFIGEVPFRDGFLNCTDVVPPPN